MASSSKQMLLFVMVAAVASSLASATVFMVGDDLGWRAKFNETGWADGKTFVLGDSLMFMYNKENHTVAQVGKDDFAACNTQGNLHAIWNSGNDAVHLDQPGKAWFICTKPNHCLNGMKLVIDVVTPSAAPAPTPFPPPPFRWPFPAPGIPAEPPFQFPTLWNTTDPPWKVAPPSAAVRNPVGGAVAAAAAVVVAAALAF